MPRLFLAIPLPWEVKQTLSEAAEQVKEIFMIFIYVTYPNFKTARKIIRALLEKRLVICANTFPVGSIYRWEDKIEESKETVSILKTTKSNWEKVKKEIAKIHPYKIPCIVKIEAKADKKYMNWILKNL